MTRQHFALQRLVPKQLGRSWTELRSKMEIQSSSSNSRLIVLLKQADSPSPYSVPIGMSSRATPQTVHYSSLIWMTGSRLNLPEQHCCSSNTAMGKEKQGGQGPYYYLASGCPVSSQSRLGRTAPLGVDHQVPNVLVERHRINVPMK